MNKIYLNLFTPRPYQLPLCEALEEHKFRKLLCIWPRRAGKDLVCWSLMIRAAIRNVGVYFYCLPTFRQARLVIWDTITNTGKRFIDYIPTELISAINNSEMKITLINGSVIQLIGSDTYDTSLVGTNPKMVVFSEYALADHRAYTLGARPILNANDGTVIIISTPRGKNHLWDLYSIAKQQPSWFVSKLTLDDTQHISAEEIAAEIASGEISQDMANQEYYTSFEMGVEGAYYASYIDRARVEGRIGEVNWDASQPVHTAWDLGVRDSTVIIFFQLIGASIHIFDCYENNKQGLEFYIKLIKDRPYNYGKHIAPHDIQVREFGSGITRIEKARQLGLRFTVAPNMSIEDGIEAVRTMMGKTYFSERNCSDLLKALNNYRQEYDHKKKVYKPRPLHDWSSHYADCTRYMAISLKKLQSGTTPEELDKRYREAMYGNEPHLGPFDDHFRDPHPF